MIEGFSNVLDLEDVNIPCAVINGPNGVAACAFGERDYECAARLPQRRVEAKEEGDGGSRGPSAPAFVAPEQLEPYISKELVDGPLAPIDYVDGDRVVRGYDAAILPAACNIWLRAREEGRLQSAAATGRRRKPSCCFARSQKPALPL